MAIDHSPLGRHTQYPSHYAPELLFPIPRQLARASLLQPLPIFYGVDLWTGYELSWLEPGGKPRVGVAEFVFPCDSEFIVESKSFKLYLNSFNQSHFASEDEVMQVIVRDLSALVGVMVEVRLFKLNAYPAIVGGFTGVCLDDLGLEQPRYQPAPELLQVSREKEKIEERVYSDLLKTNCPVTGQPDWASVSIDYRGRPIAHASLLAYIVSFREHQDFHEHCVERIFAEILQNCEPEFLTVYARYTRRGGLDINPFRSTDSAARPSGFRLVRQ